MECEFHQDQLGKMWLYHLSEIRVRTPVDWCHNHDELFSQFIINEVNKENLAAKEIYGGIEAEKIVEQTIQSSPREKVKIRRRVNVK